MCLDIDRKRTQQHSELTTNKKFIFYKHFMYTHDTKDNILTPHQKWPVPLTTNFIEAEDEIEICYKNVTRCEIYGGVIHAYQEKGFGCKCSSCFKPNSFIVPITVYANDIVAFGSDDVCFFRFKFEPKTLDYINEVRNKPNILKIYPNKTVEYLG